MSQQESGLSFERVVFFSDAVFAIVITLLVLEITPPLLARLLDPTRRKTEKAHLPEAAGDETAT